SQMTSPSAASIVVGLDNIKSSSSTINFPPYKITVYAISSSKKVNQTAIAPVFNLILFDLYYQSDRHYRSSASEFIESQYKFILFSLSSSFESFIFSPLMKTN